MEQPNDFRLYYSNALDVLAGLLAEELAHPVPGQSPLEPDIVLIPQAAMRRWLQAALAQRHGVAANIQFLAPGEFVSRALDANVPATGPDLATQALHWRLYAALHDDALMAQPALARIAAHLDGRAASAGGEAGDDEDPVKAWTLAGELAAVFEKYQAWRRDWLLRWQGGADPDDPQAILWRAAIGEDSYRARRIQQYLDRFEAPGQPLPAGLPARLFAFATLNVSPDVLRVIATQSRVGALHCYVPTPARDYWGDLQRVRAAAGAELPEGIGGENRLLQAWGAASVDFMRLIGTYEVVHASSEIQAHADPGEGGDELQGSLLRRLQSDIFHRRDRPGWPVREAVDRGDPSLQFHACHTRLRELQVLHDQLRALFDDPRFDPPLRPREVAVLAPDIDPYLPYLDAVFGQRGRDDAIPYALADASPLANEPLAEVFLRLLALPVSRFGLHEILDLLASPALAQAHGLDAAALERLHGWLSAAGARWGLDGRHRTRFDAPDDDAYTWAFALDRLLLGHASGADALVTGSDDRLVAPLPDLEGSALDALDVLLQLLRELARQASALAQALAPAQWRERLLGLLAAVLPQTPATSADERALDRLRNLINAFTEDAAEAGFSGLVPAEVVRTHFSAALAQADTRAPLLTGGVSIARMVPMRLLPFRVICVLGLNDGDFPRRDPAPGLNRLTAELGTDDRRPGDRSNRDDDRFLFLQLFTAAQDVFYLSWQGADARDGSRREPSVLVSELLAQAAAQHADPAAAEKALVVEHALQPFSAEAFGAGADPRRFSYHARWQQAAAAAVERRQPLPAWFDNGSLPPLAAGTDVSLVELRRFLLDPAGELLKRMGVQLTPIQDVGEDLEPLAGPGPGLDRHILQQALFDELLQGQQGDELHARLCARGLVPSGATGRLVLADQVAALSPWRAAFGRWRADAEPESVMAQVDIDGVRLHGRLDGVWPKGLARLRFDKPSGPSIIRAGLDWLLASAAGLEQPLVQFHDDTEHGIGPHPRSPLAVGQAKDVLRVLLSLRQKGLAEALPYAPRSGWAYFNAKSPPAGVRAAAACWHGGVNRWAEGDSDALRQVLRGRDPFAEASLLRQFVNITSIVFKAVTRGAIHDGALPADLDELVGLHEPEAEQ